MSSGKAKGYKCIACESKTTFSGSRQVERLSILPPAKRLPHRYAWRMDLPLVSSHTWKATSERRLSSRTCVTALSTVVAVATTFYYYCCFHLSQFCPWPGRLQLHLLLIFR